MIAILINALMRNGELFGLKSTVNTMIMLLLLLLLFSFVGFFGPFFSLSFHANFVPLPSSFSLSSCFTYS